jgi:hypothetical protein
MTVDAINIDQPRLTPADILAAQVSAGYIVDEDLALRPALRWLAGARQNWG